MQGKPLRIWEKEGSKQILENRGGEDVGVYDKCKAIDGGHLDINRDCVISGNRIRSGLPIFSGLVLQHTMVNTSGIVLRASVGDYSSNVFVPGSLASTG